MFKQRLIMTKKTQTSIWFIYRYKYAGFFVILFYQFIDVWLQIGRASFTDYSKATRVRKFYTAYTGVVETNNLYPAPLSHLYMHRHSCMCNFLAGLHICHVNKERTHTAVVLFHICLQYTLLYSYNAHLLSTPATFKTQKDIIYKLHR